MRNALSSGHYFVLYSLLAIAYIIGLFVPLMDSDAAHHANIALHMYLHHDFVNLIDKGKDYLDKPHMLFWLSGLSYYIFGVNAFAYKLPSFLLSIGAIYATKKLGDKLYNKDTGSLAGIIVASAQAFILACNDVRMDAMLTAAIILAAWQLVEAVQNNKWVHYLLAALFMALGFATKGLVGIIMPGIAIFFYLLYKRDWVNIFNWRWLMVFLFIAIFISPVLYSYYLQYDLHPEKTIRGMTNISGVQFILWGQNIERLDGSSLGKGKSDYTFYLHTMLWAFLPWCIIAYYAIGSRLKNLVQTRFAAIRYEEGLTIGTIVFIFILISISRFQLPHYLNILFPFFAIISAARLSQLNFNNQQKALKIIYYIQLFIAFILICGVLIINIWAFPVTNFLVIILGMAVLGCTIFFMVRRDSFLIKIVLVSVACMAFVNIMLNGNFYPKIMEYQGGSNLASLAKQHNIPAGQTVFYNTHSSAFEFETASLSPIVSLPQIKSKPGNVYVFTNPSGLDTLQMQKLPIVNISSSPQFRATRLNIKFVNPATRPAALDTFYLVHINNAR